VDALKNELMEMVVDFNSNFLDKRLNFGVFTLVPKVKEVKSIKQYRPICLLNVDFKIFSKLPVDRLTSMIDSLISKNQTAFIKERSIWKGVVILHEILHELK
jgi:hypothetical protein